ncbi:T9SS type A sorting domain-containing protein [Winogradskyella sp.]|uniref:T9SS type A sorting domain-containing protein n=1 Tax=Winogradskyella sp. TaxID=1883156 RepID=UPI0025CFA339|nr:T9SS type A sorting domain-containing protein [Winogradskyella sp.]
MTLKTTFKTFQLIIATLIVGVSTQAQTIDYKSLSSETNSNFHQIVEQTRQEFNALHALGNLTRAERKAEKQFERWVYAWKDRINTNGSFPDAENLEKYKEEALRLQSQNQFQQRMSTTWTQVGPVANPTINGYAAFPGKGRVNVVAEDPTNTQILYAGSAAGGIWKTIDGGSTWAPKSDNLAGIGVTDILVDPSNTSIIYMATGDEDAEHISSIGLFKSTDGGDTWLPTGLTFALSDNEYIRDIAFAPGSSTKLFALTNDEVKISTDSGTTWTNATISTGFIEKFQTIVFDPNDATKVIVSDYWNGLYSSTDSGSSFTIHSTFGGGGSKDVLKLVTTPNDNDFFYAISQNGEFRKYRFAINDTAADLISTTIIAGYNSQGGYNICAAISPTNKNNIVVGGVRGYKSIDGGATFAVLLNPYNNPPGVGFYVHPDHHHMSFLPDGDTVFNGHDGGVHRGSFTGSPTWTDLSPGLVITQPYNIAITQSASGDDFMMANQDNDGFSKVLKDGTRQWVSAVAGDGTAAGIDYNTPDTRYLGGTKGALYRTDDGYASSYDSSTTILSNDTNAAFVSPMAVHPTSPTTIYAAHNDVKRSTDRGDNFTALNSGLTTVDFIDVTTNGSSTRIYAISEDGTAKRSDDDGSNWITISPPVGLTFNSFSAMPNTTTVFATTKGYQTGKKVFKSVNNGATWTNISDGLPNIIMKKVAAKVDATDETLFLGTELGVYWKNNTMTNWEKLESGLPNVIISDLKINYTDQLLYIGTFGRGMWSRSINSGTLGVDDSKFETALNLLLFPNPVASNGDINLKISSTYLNEDLQYAVFNFVGGLVKEGNIDSELTTINTKSLASGVYLIRVNRGTQSIVRKLMIK